MDELIAAFKRLCVAGKTDEQLYLMAGDVNQVAELFPPNSMGALQAIATAFVNEGCAECAVTTVIEEKEAKASETHFPGELVFGG